MNQFVISLRIIIVIAFLSSISCCQSLTILVMTQSLEYQVQVGDSRTYIYNKAFDYFSTSPYELHLMESRENGTFVSVIIKKGTIMTVTITSIPTSGLIFGTRAYNGNITLKEESLFLFIKKTVNNRTYWEEYCHNAGYFNDVNQSSISGELIAEKYTLENQTFQTNQGLILGNISVVTKWNWKTGWPVYQLIQEYNNTTLFYEVEWEIISTSKNEKENPYFPYALVLFTTVLMVIIIVVYYQWKKN